MHAAKMHFQPACVMLHNTALPALPAAALECETSFIGVDCCTDGEPLNTIDILRAVALLLEEITSCVTGLATTVSGALVAASSPVLVHVALEGGPVIQVLLEGGSGPALGCLKFPRSLLVGVEGLDLVLEGPLLRVGVFDAARVVGLVPALDGLAITAPRASLIGFGFAGLANVPRTGLSCPAVSKGLLRIFFPGCTNPEPLTIAVQLGGLIFLGIAAATARPCSGTFWSSGGFVRRFVSVGFLTCEGSAEGMADAGRRLFSLD